MYQSLTKLKTKYKNIARLILECTTSFDCRNNPRGRTCDRNGRCCNRMHMHNRVCINGGGGRGMKSNQLEKLEAAKVS